MINRLASYLVDRTPRERLLLVATVLLVLSAAWFFVLMPLNEARARAQLALFDALETQRWVVARDADFRAANPDTPRQIIEPVGIAGIERALRDYGLRDLVGRLENGEDGRIALAFDRVPFGNLAAFGGRMTGLGYRIEDFRIDATDRPGQVSASLSLTPQSLGR